MTSQERLKAGLQNDSMQFYNFTGKGGDPENDLLNFMYTANPTAFGYDANALGYDANALNYSGPFPSGTQPKWTQEAIAAANLTSFRCKVIWALGTGGLVKNPVDVTFFRSSFNTGVFNGSGDLVFTNAAGNTATIKGMNISFQKLMQITETEPFNLAFARIAPKSTSQLLNTMQILENTQWGSFKGNELTPDDYLDPYQEQTLRIDVPFNMPIDRKHGFTWTIDSDQDGNGCGITFWVNTTLSPTNAVMNKPVVQQLGNGVQQAFYTPQAPAGQIRNMIAQHQLAGFTQRPMVQNMLQNHPMINNLVHHPMAAAAAAPAMMGAAGLAAPALLAALGPFAPALATPQGQQLLHNVLGKIKNPFHR